MTTFNQAYYTEGARGGFTESLGKNLQNKWSACPACKSVLFVGCATGEEVRFWENKGIEAQGCDISEWAVNNSVSPRVKLYDGRNLDWLEENCIELVCAYDVLTLVEGYRTRLAEEMVRVAKDGIVVRTTVSHHENENLNRHGIDGVPFRLESIGYWDKLFTQSGKFWLQHLEVNSTSINRREALYVFNHRTTFSQEG